MRIGRKLVRGLVMVLVILVVAGFAVRRWVVPGLVARELQKKYGGKIEFSDWWFGRKGAGVSGLKLHEGPEADSPIWAEADRVETNLTPADLWRGRTLPTRVELDEPRLLIRIARDGRLLTKLPIKTTGPMSASLPEIVVRNAQVTFRQEGRPEMVLTRVNGRGEPEDHSLKIGAQAEDPTWGKWVADGRYSAKEKSFQIELAGVIPAADKQKEASLPFVTDRLGLYVVPFGPVGIRLVATMASQASTPGSLQTYVTFLHDKVELPSLGLTATDTVGDLEIEKGVVQLKNVKGQMIGGRVTLNGPLDFSVDPQRFDLDIGLEGVDVTQMPKNWHVAEMDVTGRLTGQTQLRVILRPQGTDFSESTADVNVQQPTVKGIPLDRLRLVVANNHAEPPSRTPQHTDGPAGGMRLPPRVRAIFGLDEADLPSLLHHAEALGVDLPAAERGRVTFDGEAVIPLQAPRDLKAYVVRGNATIENAAMSGVDVGEVSTPVSLADGVLELADIEGWLPELPDGIVSSEPPPPRPPVVDGQSGLSTGGFEGRLRAELAPAGKLSVTIKGYQIPLCELVAPVLPRPTPITGSVSIEGKAEGPIQSLSDPASWSASGKVEQGSLVYQGSTIDSLATRFQLANAQLDLPDLTARLLGQPLKLSGHVGVTKPYLFAANVETQAWSMSELVSMTKGRAHAEHVNGALSLKGEAEGSLSPLDLFGKGSGLADQFRIGPLPVGPIRFGWTIDENRVTLAPLEARPFGGRLEGEARIAINGKGPAEGSASLTDVDTAAICRALPDWDLRLTGRASGQLVFKLPAGSEELHADVRLAAPNMTIHSLPAESLQATLKARNGVVSFDVAADSLGGRVEFRGDAPMFAIDAAHARGAAHAEIQASGFQLDNLWRAYGLTGTVSQLHGVGRFDANLRTSVSSFEPWAHGIVELKDLRWGENYPLGHLRGEVQLTPTSWRIDPVLGALFGSPAQGLLWGDRPTQALPQMGFDLKVENASLPQAASMIPELARHLSGYGAIRIAGGFEEGFHANAEAHVSRAHVFGMPLTMLHAPAELVVTRSAQSGSLKMRRWSAHMAGGHVHGDAEFHFGTDRSFHAESHLEGVEIETLLRSAKEDVRRASGKLSGRIELQGPSPSQLRRMRGKVELDLNDAALFEMPVFREINRFLGEAGSGVFEDGDLYGVILNEQLMVEEMTLVGRLVQLHASGTVGFDGRLNLFVLINTNALIGQRGQSLLALVPGRGGVGGMGPFANFLSARLMKLRVTGTIHAPVVERDREVQVSDGAAGFFAEVFRLPLLRR